MSNSPILGFLRTDASVTITELVSVSEANGTAEVCVSPGITGSITATLSITLQVNDRKAGKKMEFDDIDCIEFL